MHFQCEASNGNQAMLFGVEARDISDVYGRVPEYVKEWATMNGAVISARDIPPRSERKRSARVD